MLGRQITSVEYLKLLSSTFRPTRHLELMLHAFRYGIGNSVSHYTVTKQAAVNFDTRTVNGYISASLYSQFALSRLRRNSNSVVQPFTSYSPADHV